MMKVFVILFCFLIGFACVDSQRVQIGDDDLGSEANAARKASSPNSDEALNEDQRNNRRRSGPVYSPVKAVGESSEEVEAASEKPSQPDPVNAVKPVTSKVEKSGQTVQSDLWSIMKSSHQLSSANRSLTKINRDSPKQSSEIHVTDDAGLEPKVRRRLLRKRRDAAWEKMHKRMKGGWGAAGLSMQLFGIRGTDEVGNAMDAARDKEKEVLKSLSATGTVSTELLKEYKAAKAKFRKLFKEQCAAKTYIKDTYLDSYEGFFNDGASNGYIGDTFHLREDNMAFFDTPSSALDKYYEMKRKEVKSIRGFVDGSGPDIYDGPIVNEFTGEKSSGSGGGDSGAKSGDFECPKKKRQSESVAAKMSTAQEFVVFVCVVIGVLVVHLQRGLEIGEDHPKGKQKASTVKDRIRSTESRVDRSRQIQPIG